MPEATDVCLMTNYSFSPSVPISLVAILVSIFPMSVLFELMSHNHDRLNLLGNAELLASIGSVISWQRFSDTGRLEQNNDFFLKNINANEPVHNFEMFFDLVQNMWSGHKPVN